MEVEWTRGNIIDGNELSIGMVEEGWLIHIAAPVFHIYSLSPTGTGLDKGFIPRLHELVLLGQRWPRFGIALFM